MSKVLTSIPGLDRAIENIMSLIRIVIDVTKKSNRVCIVGDDCGVGG